MIDPTSLQSSSQCTRCAASCGRATGRLCAARRRFSRFACVLVIGTIMGGTLTLSTGCQSFGQNKAGLFSAFRKSDVQAEDPLLAQSPSHDEEASNRRSIFRWLRKSKETELRPTPREAMEEYDVAHDLFLEERYDDAQDAFKAISKKYENTPIVEDCQFMMAECEFGQKKYSWAQDGYEKLLEKYPSSRHLDTCTRRLFSIAQIWLNDPSFASRSELQQVDLEDKIVSPLPATEPKTVSEWPIIPNLFDRSRPVFDTPGRALEALRNIWIHDPTGPLADDALMLSASYYLRKGDYQEADRMLTLLREEYPKSPHLEDAFMIGSHVKLMSYQGANYDKRHLEDAEQLKKATLKLFPNDVDKGRLEEELKKIDHAKALREWESVQYYMRKNLPHSAAVHCKILIEKFPETEFAERAYDLLTELGPKADPPDLRPKKSFWSFRPLHHPADEDAEMARIAEGETTTDETENATDESAEDEDSGVTDADASSEESDPAQEDGVIEIEESDRPGLRRMTPAEAGRVNLHDIPENTDE
ncbi:MAG: outer membrane protein assembly factor BamD [Planctomycetaceae bacterium]